MCRIPFSAVLRKGLWVVSPPLLSRLWLLPAVLFLPSAQFRGRTLVSVCMKKLQQILASPEMISTQVDSRKVAGSLWQQLHLQAAVPKSTRQNLRRLHQA